MEELERIPLEERLARLARGERNPGCCAALVRRWEAAPLRDYLTGQPVALERLEVLLGSEGMKMTYGQAARWCHRLLRSPATRKKGLDLLWYLSFPLQGIYKGKGEKK